MNARDRQRLRLVVSVALLASAFMMARSPRFFDEHQWLWLAVSFVVGFGALDLIDYCRGG